MLGNRLANRLANMLGNMLANMLGNRLTNMLGNRLGNRLAVNKLPVCLDQTKESSLTRTGTTNRHDRVKHCGKWSAPLVGEPSIQIQVNVVRIKSFTQRRSIKYRLF